MAGGEEAEFSAFAVRDGGELLGCTAGTVKSHTHRALARLRDVLADLAGVAPDGTAHGERKQHADR